MRIKIRVPRSEADAEEEEEFWREFLKANSRFAAVEPEEEEGGTNPRNATPVPATPQSPLASAPIPKPLPAISTPATPATPSPSPPPTSATAKAGESSERRPKVPTTREEGQKITCAGCQAANPSLTCSKCLRAKYCSAACQRENWKAHKSGCGSGSAAKGEGGGDATRTAPARTVVSAHKRGLNLKLGRWPGHKDGEFQTLTLDERLFELASDGSLGMVSKLAALGGNVNWARPSDGQGPLHVAALRGQTLMVHGLLSLGADINGVDHVGRTALFYAADKGRDEIAGALLERGAKVNLSAEPFRDTPCIVATKRGHDVILSRLLEHGANVHLETAPRGYTALILAAKHGQTKCAAMLLDKGADVNDVKLEGKTALIEACNAGQVAVARLLLQRGAKAVQVDHHGDSPLYDACLFGHDQIVALLLESGAACQINRPNKRGFYPLHAACEATAVGPSKEKCLLMLLRSGANPDITHLTSNKTPLHVAVEAGNDRVCLALLNAGAGVDKVNIEGGTALFNALRCGAGNESVVRLLLRHNACVNLANKMGTTPLIMASNKGNLANIVALLDKGAEIDATDSRGNTALLLGTAPSLLLSLSVLT